VVGVNRFVQEDKLLRREMQKLDTAVESDQCARIQAIRAQRDNDKISELRAQLVQAAQSNENLMPLFVTCVENDMTLGEICHTLRGVWGEYRPRYL
jgi:methylmalonyl-CoA mutase, N-terminal domain